ncbi:dienelactone hydrolase family protein [Povalibacter sp.]|uniref:dienelactone hydrolase family protein n=1 Tax=Povalibacter sp. TaxID=1962978 RepID=UPI002F41F58E
MRLVLIPLLLLLLQACVNNAQRIDRQAAAAQLTRSVVAGREFRHVVYANGQAANATTQRLLVYLDGDGRPWGANGREPAADPTTRNPVALQLLAQTTAPAIYVSRPCYQRMNDSMCGPATWTSDRYSAVVVDSLAAAIQQAAGDDARKQIVLVGYSGGGVLAVLVAERLANVAAVITIAANLDIDAWTQHHHYLPLTGSSNPASSMHDHPWPEVHLQGTADHTVPAATTARYFARYPLAQRRQFDEFTHVCCWVEQWPEIFASIAGPLEMIPGTAQ